MSLLDKLKKNTTIGAAAILSQSKFFTDADMIQTPIPIINLALSGRLSGGLTPGLTVFAGQSKHFKTSFALLMASAYLDKYKDAVVLFYDSEFGSPQSYFKTFGIDTDRVLHTPITDVEQLKHDVMNQLNNIDAKERVIIVIDSLGNLASKKEVDDALEGKAVADMSRAKAVKSLFRMVTPHLRIKDIPMVVVNHTYKEIGMYPKDIMSGGTGVLYSADTVWIIGRQQEKDGNELTGYNFVINVEKSRFVREKSKLPVTVSFDGGIQPYSGLLDLAIEGEFVNNPLAGWYQKGKKAAKVRFDDTQTDAFWKDILDDPKFQEFVRKKYEVAYGSILPTHAVVTAADSE